MYALVFPQPHSALSQTNLQMTGQESAFYSTRCMESHCRTSQTHLVERWVQLAGANGLNGGNCFQAP